MKSSRYIHDTSTLGPPVIMHLGTKSMGPRDGRHNPNNALLSQTAVNRDKVPAPAPGVELDIHCDVSTCTSKRAAVAFCSDCCQFLCETCSERHNSERLFQNHRSIPLAKKTKTAHGAAASQQPLLRPPPGLCPNPEHKSRRLKYYCESCSVPACYNCLQDNHAGHAHNTLSVDGGGGTRDHHGRLRETLEAAHSMLTQLKAAINSHDDGILQIESSKVTAVTLVVSAFRELQHSLERRRQALLERVERVAAERRANLVHRREELQRMQDELSQFNETTLLGDNLDAAARRVMSLQEKYAYDVAPKWNTSISVAMDTGWLMERVDHFGIVDDCSPTTSGWSQRAPPLADRPYMLEVETKDAGGGLVRAEGLDLRVETGDRSGYHRGDRHGAGGGGGGATTSGRVEDHGDGTYTVSLTPEGAGHRQLTITINGQHVRRSPCEQYVGVRDYDASLSEIRQAFEAKQPQYVDLDGKGCVYVSSYRRSHHHGYVDVLNADGTRKFAIGCYGNGCGMLDSPRGLAVRGEVIFVSDCGNHKVLKLTTGGKFLLSFGRPGSGEGDGSLKRPVGLCVDAEGNVIVADSGNHRIQTFDQDGRFLRSIRGSRGPIGSTLGRGARGGTLSPRDADVNGSLGRPSQDCSFYSPYDVAVDPQGNIHVAANNTNAIKVFTPEGEFVRAYGNLSGPTGIAVDPAGFCFVCQSSNSSPSSSSSPFSSPSSSSASPLSSSSPSFAGGGPGSTLVVFDPRGNQIKMLHGVQGAYGVAVDKEGNVLVADWIKNQVVRY